MRVLKFTILFITLLAGGLATYNLFDRPLHKKFETFFYEESIDLTQNGYLAYLGLAAPADEHIFSYGTKMLNNSALSENQLSVSNELDLGCWLAQRALLSEEEINSCPTNEELEVVLRDNALLLQRYKSLEEYESFSEIGFGKAQTGVLLIQLNELYLAKLVLLHRKNRHEEALTLWLENTKFWNRVIADKQNMVSKAIILMIHNSNLSTLPKIVSHQTAKKYEVELMEVLSFDAFGEDGWDVAATMRAEYEAIKVFEGRNDYASSLLYKPNASRNAFFEYTNDVIRLTKEPLMNFELAKRRFDDAYGHAPIWESVIYNPVGNLMLNGLFAGTNLLNARINSVIYAHLLKAYIQAKVNNIQTEAMSSFLQKEELLHPVSALPFLWDSERQIIYALKVEASGSRHEVFYSE